MSEPTPGIEGATTDEPPREEEAGHADGVSSPPPTPPSGAVPIDWRTAGVTSVGWTAAVVMLLLGRPMGALPSPQPVEVKVQFQLPEELRELREEGAKLRALVEQLDRRLWELEHQAGKPAGPGGR